MKTLLSILGISLLVSSCALVPTRNDMINDCVEQELKKGQSVTGRIFGREKLNVTDVVEFCEKKFPVKD